MTPQSVFLGFIMWLLENVDLYIFFFTLSGKELMHDYICMNCLCVSTACAPLCVLLSAWVRCVCRVTFSEGLIEPKSLKNVEIFHFILLWCTHIFLSCFALCVRVRGRSLVWLKHHWYLNVCTFPTYASMLTWLLLPATRRTVQLLIQWRNCVHL